MYGKGCPWKCQYANPHKAYRAGDFPVAEKVYRERIMMPNFRDVAYDKKLLGQYVSAFRKISENIDELK